MTGWYLAGWVVVAAGFVIAQSRFYEAHRQEHQLWRPREETARTTLFRTPAEYRAMLKATFATASRPSVERARRTYLVVAALGVVYLLLAIPLAIIIGP